MIPHRTQPTKRFNWKERWPIVLTLVLLVLASGYVGYSWYSARHHFTTTGTDVAIDTPTETLLPLFQAADSEYALLIPKLPVTTPIILNVPTDVKKEYLAALRQGVAHYRHTALPGEPGNAVIFGHSSYYANDAGPYNEIFLSLPELKPGDSFFIRWRHDQRDEILRYQINRSEVVAANDMSVVQQDNSREIVTLITCWPPRTTWKRYVIQASRVP